MSIDFQRWSTNIQEQVELALSQLIPDNENSQHQLHQAMRYAVLSGGKRIRPLLAFASGELFDLNFNNSLAVAASLELIHGYSLIHDDLPCMDDDVLRRGRPTCHVKFGEANALLAGDALQTLAFENLAKHLFNSPEINLQLIIELSKASGANGMVLGQAIDLAAVGKKLSLEQLQFMHSKKTGALICAAVMMGAIANQANLSSEQYQTLNIFGEKSGVLFQVIDDILDVTSNSAKLGKTAGKDAANNKPTYVSLLGVKKATILAEQLHAECMKILKIFPSEKSIYLNKLLEYIITRHN